MNRFKGGINLKNNIEFNVDLIVIEYGNYVFKIIDNILNTSLPYQDKEEVVADTFYLLWKNQNKIEKNLKSYLRTIARNVAYQKLREKKEIFEYNDLLLNNYSYPKENNLIEDILNYLTEDEKELFNLYYVSGFRIREISSIKKKSVSAIKMQISRMRKKIKEASNNV